jgi:hypothetical protein
MELLSQYNCCHDPNAFLIEEISWLGLKPMYVAAKLTILQRLSLQKKKKSIFSLLLVSTLHHLAEIGWNRI